jgi:hypothetical protein
MKIDLVKLVEEVYKLEGEPKNVNKVFALICLQAFKEQLNLTDVVKSSHCELYDFGRQDKTCEKKCDSCKWMERQ